MATPPSDFVSVAECARLLVAAGDPIERSALSRYCDEHGLKSGGTKTRPLVSFSAVKAHRESNGMRTIMRGQGLSSDPASSEPATTPNDSSKGKVVDMAAKRNDPVYREREAKAAMAELDLEQRRGSVVLIDDVTAGIGDSWSALRAAETAELGLAVDSLAAELKVNDDAKRLIRVALKTYSRKVQARFHEESVRVARDLGTGSLSRTRELLERLAAISHRVRLGGRLPASEEVSAS